MQKELSKLHRLILDGDLNEAAKLADELTAKASPCLMQIAEPAAQAMKNEPFAWFIRKSGLDGDYELTRDPEREKRARAIGYLSFPLYTGIQLQASLAAAPQAVQPVAYLRFMAWQGSGSPETGPEYDEGFEVCTPNDKGSDGSAAFPVYARPTPQALEKLGSNCMDGGVCHHDCTDKCFRRECCVPLSAAMDAGLTMEQWRYPTPQGLDAARLDAIQDGCWDVRCETQTEDSYGWTVYEHHMAEPQLRAIGVSYREDGLREAIDAAIAAQAKQGEQAND